MAPEAKQTRVPLLAAYLPQEPTVPAPTTPPMPSVPQLLPNPPDMTEHVTAEAERRLSSQSSPKLSAALHAHPVSIK